MRIDLFLSGVVMLAAAAPAAAQKPFEGIIVYDVVTGDRGMQMTVSSRGSKVRRDVSIPDAPDVSRQNYQMIDFKSGEATMVFPAMKRYMVMKLGALGDAPSEAADDVESTGRVETIAGARCTIFVVKSAPGSEWCITSSGAKNGAELGALMNDLPSSGGAMPGLLRGFLRGTVVLRARMIDRRGSVMTMMATKVDRTPPPAALFQMPGDFQEMKNPSMP